MMKTTLSALLLSSALALPAMAQSSAPPATTPAAPTPPAASAPAAPSASGSFVASATVGDWRASKLAGVNIYGPDDKSVGKIDDIVLDKNGQSKLVVIAVGGVLGMGAKNVAVPFEAVTWSAEPIAVKAAPGPETTSTIPGAAPAGTPSTATAPAVPAKPSVYDYPDHGSVTMTLDQLKAAPEFKYASQH
jgi:sporulation protein YlmC with PRC-barrel domain